MILPTSPVESTSSYYSDEVPKQIRTLIDSWHGPGPSLGRQSHESNPVEIKIPQSANTEKLDNPRSTAGSVPGTPSGGVLNSVRGSLQDSVAQCSKDTINKDLLERITKEILAKFPMAVKKYVEHPILRKARVTDVKNFEKKYQKYLLDVKNNPGQQASTKLECLGIEVLDEIRERHTPVLAKIRMRG
jgi:hypothetical protein